MAGQEVTGLRRIINASGYSLAGFRACFRHEAAFRQELLALVLLGPRSAVAVAAVSAVNLGYSGLFKGVTGIDVPYVAVWGALYAMVPGADIPFAAVALVGVMTSICHIFQITRDSVGKKGPALSGRISLAGRYLVLLANTPRSPPEGLQSGAGHHHRRLSD